MKNYEALVLVRPDLNEQNLEKEIAKLSQPILNNGGRVVKFEKWTKRNLAYRIKKFQDGIYLLANFKVESRALIGIERNWKLDENVLRAMVVVK
jgi:small subunit ribosomal protein S6